MQIYAHTNGLRALYSKRAQVRWQLFLPMTKSVFEDEARVSNAICFSCKYPTFLDADYLTAIRS